MKKIRWLGIISGGLISITVILFVDHLHNSGCFSCGFISIDYCGHRAGICSESSLYVDIINLISIPYNLVLLPTYYLVSGRLFSIYTYIVKFSPLYILYGIFIGHLVEVAIRRFFFMERDGDSVS